MSTTYCPEFLSACHHVIMSSCHHVIMSSRGWGWWRRPRWGWHWDAEVDGTSEAKSEAAADVSGRDCTSRLEASSHIVLSLDGRYSFLDRRNIFLDRWNIFLDKIFLNISFGGRDCTSRLEASRYCLNVWKGRNILLDKILLNIRIYFFVPWSCFSPSEALAISLTHYLHLGWFI